MTLSPIQPSIIGRAWHPTLAAAVVAVTAAGLFAGCGSDESGLSPVEYREQANAVCTAVDPQIGALFGELAAKGDSATPDDLQSTLDQLGVIVRGEIDDLAALEPPSDMKDDVDEMLAATRSAIDEAESQGLGFFEGDDDPFAEAQSLAGELGIDACSGG